MFDKRSVSFHNLFFFALSKIQLRNSWEKKIRRFGNLYPTSSLSMEELGTQRKKTKSSTTKASAFYSEEDLEDEDDEDISFYRKTYPPPSQEEEEPEVVVTTETSTSPLKDLDEEDEHLSLAIVDGDPGITYSTLHYEDGHHYDISFRTSSQKKHKKKKNKNNNALDARYILARLQNLFFQGKPPQYVDVCRDINTNTISIAFTAKAKSFLTRDHIANALHLENCLQFKIYERTSSDKFSRNHLLEDTLEDDVNHEILKEDPLLIIPSSSSSFLPETKSEAEDITTTTSSSSFIKEIEDLEYPWEKVIDIKDLTKKINALTREEEAKGKPGLHWRKSYTLLKKELVRCFFIHVEKKLVIFKDASGKEIHRSFEDFSQEMMEIRLSVGKTTRSLATVLFSSPQGGPPIFNNSDDQHKEILEEVPSLPTKKRKSKKLKETRKSHRRISKRIKLKKMSFSSSEEVEEEKEIEKSLSDTWKPTLEEMRTAEIYKLMRKGKSLDSIMKNPIMEVFILKNFSEFKRYAERLLESDK